MDPGLLIGAGRARRGGRFVHRRRHRARAGPTPTAAPAELVNTRRYTPNSSFTAAKASSAIASSARVCAAETWVRIRALPGGTTG